MSITVFVKDILNNKRTIKISKTATVGELKLQAQDIFGMDLTSAVFNGTVLINNEKTLESIDLKNNSWVQIIGRMNGGYHKTIKKIIYS